MGSQRCSDTTPSSNVFLKRLVQVLRFGKEKDTDEGRTLVPVTPMSYYVCPSVR